MKQLPNTNHLNKFKFTLLLLLLLIIMCPYLFIWCLTLWVFISLISFDYIKQHLYFFVIDLIHQQFIQHNNSFLFWHIRELIFAALFRINFYEFYRSLHIQWNIEHVKIYGNHFFLIILQKSLLIIQSH